jgi:hypothetical protein
MEDLFEFRKQQLLGNTGPPGNTKTSH